MGLPELNFDDFYKFVMSGGIVFFLAGFGTAMYGLFSSSSLIAVIPGIVVLGFGLYFIIWSGVNWYRNQKLLDRRLEAETVQIERITAASAQDNEKKILHEIRQESDTQIDTAFKPDAEVQAALRTAKSDINLFTQTKDPVLLLNYYKNFEMAVVKKLKTLYPKACGPVTLDSNTASPLFIDAISIFGGKTLLFEIKLFRSHLSPNKIVDIVRQFDGVVSEYKLRTHENDVHGVVVIAFDYHTFDESYRQHIIKRFDFFSYDSKNKPGLLLLDLNELAIETNNQDISSENN